MDKEKQIEDMAKDLKEEKLYALINKTSYMRSAENLYDLGYRKINENEVVISKEEKQKLLKEMYEQGKFDAIADLEKEGKVVISKEEYERIWKKGYEEGYSILVNDTIKKTAEKILKYLDRHLGNGKLAGNVLSDCAKEFGVDLGE